MKLRQLSIWTIVAAFACAAPALAEYGSWEKIYSIGGTPGLSNAAFMSLGIGDADNLYTAGVQQTGGMTIDWAWSSHDGGYNWTPVIQTSASGSGCDILNLFSFVITAGAAKADTAVFAGVQVSPDCIAENEFPACMFKCIWLLEPSMYVTTDGGESVQSATLNGFGMYNMVMAIQFVDESLGYGAGVPNLLARTQDGGQSWTKINAPGSLATYYNDVQFFDADNGFLVSGVPEEEKASGDPAKDAHDRLRFALNWVKDPLFRMEWRDQPATPAKGQYGKLYRTTDGGATWDNPFSVADASFLNIEMLDLDAGFIIGEPHTGTYPLVMYETQDGGDTWNDVSSRLPQDLPNVMKWAVSALSFQPTFSETGFIGGAGRNLLSYLPVLFYTTDRGQTWQADETVQELENPILQLKWANPKTAFTVGFELSVFKYTQANVPPLADAGDDGTGAVNEAVALDGSGSFDYDGDALTYQWAQLSGPTATIADAAAVQTTFTAAEPGEVVMQLTVNDGQEDGVDSATFTIAASGDDDDDAGDDDDDDDSAGGTDDDVQGDDDDDDSGCGC